MTMDESMLSAILDAYPYEIVFADREHIVRYMNRAAQRRYQNVVRIGASLFNCHNERAKAKIEEFLARADAGETGEFFEVLNRSTDERKFFDPVRDRQGRVVGYFERHEVHWDFDAPDQPVRLPGV